MEHYSKEYDFSKLSYLSAPSNPTNKTVKDSRSLNNKECVLYFEMEHKWHVLDCLSAVHRVVILSLCQCLSLIQVW